MEQGAEMEQGAGMEQGWSRDNVPIRITGVIPMDTSE